MLTRKTTPGRRGHDRLKVHTDQPDLSFIEPQKRAKRPRPTLVTKEQFDAVAHELAFEPPRLSAMKNGLVRVRMLRKRLEIVESLIARNYTDEQLLQERDFLNELFRRYKLE